MGICGDHQRQLHSILKGKEFERTIRSHYGLIMPKLSIFALCEKVIMDKEDRASLISLFNTISAQILPTNQAIPSNAVAPKEWYVYTSWETEPEDIGKEYRQVVQLLYPNGEPFSPPVGINF